MQLVTVPTPLGPIAINPQEIFCIVPEPHNPGQAEMRYDDNRHVLAMETAEAVVAQLGGDFRRLAAASLDFDRAWISPIRVSSVVPHPQHPNVCFVTGINSKIAVNGDLQSVSAALR